MKKSINYSDASYSKEFVTVKLTLDELWTIQNALSEYSNEHPDSNDFLFEIMDLKTEALYEVVKKYFNK